MKKTITGLLCIFLCLCGIHSLAQENNYGLWEYAAGPSSSELYPIKGRMTIIKWRDIEPSNNQFNWQAFDDVIAERTNDGLPTIFKVYTKEDAPDWIFENGVPKVFEKDINGNITGYSPYYADPEYKTFFKRMVTKVREHIETLDPELRNKIIGVQAALGSTGDYISYKGEVDPQYFLTSNDFFALFQEFSLHFYNEYKDTNPKITLLSNPKNTGSEQTDWVMANTPGWLKCGTLGKGYQLNDEKTKYEWLYKILNTPSGGDYVRARSEMSQQIAQTGWWNENVYGNQFAQVCYAIFWGLDWPNQNLAGFSDANSDSVYRFFNRYAGQKDPLQSPYAMCALKDVLDAADGERFPASTYGAVDRNNIQRYRNIVNDYAAFGAKIGDASTVNLTELEMMAATAINDVGWDLIPGNYDRYLHQIDANETSAGYWNIKATADENSMYGRFGRGFDLANNKDALYFDLDNAFLQFTPLDSAYPVTIDIVYLDKGTGSFGLYYDSKTNGTDNLATQINCTNSNKWKRTSILLNDAYFGDRGTKGSDFYLKNMGTENVIFSIVELSRPKADLSDIGLLASPLIGFDTICYNAESAPNSFILSGNFLDGTNVKVGPFENFKFSLTSSGTFTDSLFFENYGSGIKSSVFVKFIPEGKVIHQTGAIPVSGSGYTIEVPVSATSVNSLPTITDSVNNISCFNRNDGQINLAITGGIGPFSYLWKSPTSRFMAETEDIAQLRSGEYNFTLTSAYKCSYTDTFSIVNPERLGIGFTLDSTIYCRGGSTTVQVFATGGTAPFTGTGTFTTGPGFKYYTVTDDRGCTVTKGFRVANGTNSIPARPKNIIGNSAFEKGLCNGGNYEFSTTSVWNATSYTWTLPTEGVITSSENEGLSIIADLLPTTTNQTISVKADNRCGSSKAFNKVFKYLPAKPSAITGPSNVNVDQTVNYSVKPVEGLTYTWTVPWQSEILSGQNGSSILVSWGSRSGKVIAKAKNNCGNSAGSSLYVTVGAGFNRANPEYSQSSMKSSTVGQPEIKITPNPATEKVVISINGKENINLIQLFDVAGKMIYHKTVSNSTVIIKRSELKAADGIYFITITAGKVKYKQKLILQ